MEDACIGCSLCALACPYDAIEMHDLEEKPLLQIRLQKENKLAYGEGKPRKAKLRRIASKCDHCVSYEDQACISARPTSALLEIPPEAAFTERTDSMADAAKKGFEHSVMFDVNEIFDPKKFYKGLSEEDDKAKKQEQRFRTGWLWLISLLGTIGCIVEIALRKEWPELSLLFYYLTKYLPEDHPLHLDPETALANIDFRPGAPFALWLGYIGTVIMFSSMFYSVHKWVPRLKKAGRAAGDVRLPRLGRHHGPGARRSAHRRQARQLGVVGHLRHAGHGHLGRHWSLPVDRTSRLGVAGIALGHGVRAQAR